jgi:hypothetical protein
MLRRGIVDPDSINTEKRNRIFTPPKTKKNNTKMYKNFNCKKFILLGKTS